MIFHITTFTQWKAAQKAGAYQSESLASEGFIHCSQRHQVLSSARKHFQGQKELIVLGIAPEKLKAEVRVERGAGSTQDFPHIYGAINLDAVVSVIDLDPEQAGDFTPPPDVPA